MLKNPKGPPFSVFRHCETFFSKICFFFAKESPFNCDKNVDNFRSVPPFSGPEARVSGPLARHSVHFFGFSIFEYCKLTLGSPFAIFKPWIWCRLGPVPACFYYILFHYTLYLLYRKRFKTANVLVWYGIKRYSIKSFVQGPAKLFND